MGKALVIAEKPSVGRDLARALPGPFAAHDGYLEGLQHVVTWAIGHLLSLAPPEAYDPKFKRWRAEDLPIRPASFKLSAIDKRSRQQLAVIRKLAQRVEIAEVVNACDAGREGELIFSYIWQSLPKVARSKPRKRLWLSSLTKEAIEAAFENLRDAADFAGLEAAARSRAEADWLVGMNATRAATLQLRSAFDGVVSMGRVQTPTLAILAAREREIRDFTVRDYWIVEATFATPGGATYEGRYEDGKRFDDRKQATAIAEACRNRPAEVTTLKTIKGGEKPPALYDLTSLQRDANSRYGFSAKRTLAAAQRLYEQRKAISYPRTDSRYLPSDMADDALATIELVGANAPYRPFADYIAGLEQPPLERVINDAKVTDHHAIVPTRARHSLAAMDADERKVYDLVARRLIAALYPPARFRRTQAETTVDGADRKGHRFVSEAKVYTQLGWRSVYDEEPGTDLPSLEKGQRVKAAAVEAVAKQTRPPRRYTDSGLLAAMETAGKLVEDDAAREAMKESGLGTPATRAQIIERLLDVGYLERDKRSLLVTDKGLQLIELLGDHDLTKPQLTGEWERRLREIERGRAKRDEFMCDIDAFTARTVAELSKITPPRVEPTGLGACPGCGRALAENGKAYSCWRREDPGCGLAIWKRFAGKQLPKWAVKELIAEGRTSKPVEGFRAKSGRRFSARLAIRKRDGKPQLCFDEDWAR